LRELDADPYAKDPVRVMRLAAAYNSKSGKRVESIFENLDEDWEFTVYITRNTFLGFRR
jgi:tryptophan 2,3-dioxygenase